MYESQTAFLTSSAGRLTAGVRRTLKRFVRNEGLQSEETVFKSSELTGLSDKIFDNLARTLGTGLQRRDVFKFALAGVASAALAEFGVKTAWAVQSCQCQGQTYDPTLQCCTPSGVQQKHPVVNLTACTNKVDHPGYTCIPNGCGAEGGPHVPNGFGAASFLSGLNNHDCLSGQGTDVKDRVDK